MKRTLLTLASAICFIGFSQSGKTGLNNAIDSLSYSLGIEYAGFIKSNGQIDLNVEVFAKALNDYLNNMGLAIHDEAAKQYINQYFNGLKDMEAQENLKKGQDYLEKNKQNEGVVELPSGLQYKVIANGEGAKPTINDKVECHYEGKLIDGTIFDSSYERGESIDFPLNGVIPGWTEALQLMSVGSKWTLYIPAHLAYGERGAGGVIGPNETLIFEVELLGIK